MCPLNFLREIKFGIPEINSSNVLLCFDLYSEYSFSL